ncbi:MAG: sigma-70 family RNA polymerase sigma factor, partial [Thermoleophilia bacterium]
MAVAIPLRRGARSQSEGALTAALYRQHAGELLRFAWHRLGRLEDAEDAVQATFLSAHRVLAEGERVREPRAWLFRILRNECLTRLAMTKRRGVHEELGEWHADSRASVADQMESNDEFDVAVALLATLPEQQREAIVLREWLGMSAIETADVLDVTPQGVDALVYRARKALVGLADVEEESACGVVRQALADAKVNAKIRAHLLACRSCRSAARRLHAPEEMAAANGFLPLDSIASRLGESIPGFAVAGGAVAAAGGGVAAAGVASSLLAGTAAKVVVTVAVGAVVAAGAVREAPAIRNALSPASNVRQLATAPPAKPAASADGTKRVVSAAQAAAGTAAANVAATPAPKPDQTPIVAAAAAAAAPATVAPENASAPAEAVPAEAAPAVAPVEPAPVAAVPPTVKTPPAPTTPAPTTPAPATGSAPKPTTPAPTTPVGGKAPTTPAPTTPAPATGSAPKPTTPAAPRTDNGKKAAEAAAEQAKRAAEQAAAQAKKAAEAAAEQAKKAAEAAAEQAKKAAEAAKKAAEAAKTPAKGAAPVAVAPVTPVKSAPKGESPKPAEQTKPAEQPKQSKPAETPKPAEQAKPAPVTTPAPAPAAAPV